MIHKVSAFYLSFLLMILTLSAYGQECQNFHKSNDCYVYVPDGRDFQIYNQARSTYADVGITNIYKVVLFGKKDYIVGVCAEAKYYRQIRLRIIDSNSKKVLFDNKEFDFIESFGFTIDKTQPLDLEITVLSKEKIVAGTKICLGIQILWSKTLNK